MEKKNQADLCLVDASSFVFRAYYAVRYLSNKKGLATNAIFGYANMILKVLEELQPKYIAIVHDTKHPSFRLDLYKEYKANRDTMPDDLVPQMPYIKDFATHLGLPAFEKKGFEADDIIAALAKFGSKAKKSVCIVSSDKDLMQLVDEHVYMFDTMKDRIFRAPEVMEKMGVGPELICDYLALVGDSSDNIPGVKGIGPKSASKLLNEYGSLDGIYQNFDQIKKSKQKENLGNEKELAYLSKKLATVVTDVGIDFDWDSLQCKPHFSEKMERMLEELEFRNMPARIQNALANYANGASRGTSLVVENNESKEVETSGLPKANYICLQSKTELQTALKQLEKSKEIALDTETDGLAYGAKMIGFSFCANEKEAYYVPLAHQEGKQCKTEEALELFAKFLSKRKVVGQNIKFDLNVFRQAGFIIDAKQVAFDTMLASYVLNPENRHNMDFLSEKYLSHSPVAYEEVCGKGKDEITFDQVELEPATEYAAEDAHITWLLYQKMKKEIEQDKELTKIYYSIELPLIPVLADMEWEGMQVNIPYLKKMSKAFDKELERLTEEAYTLAGEEFNLASPKQLQEILFKKLGLTPTKKTKTGFSTNVEVLKTLAWQHELPAIILEYREIAKLKNTYVDVIPELANGSARVHSSFNQTVAATGRLSSSDPNMQNIPIRTEMGKKIREAFVAKEDCVLVGADYSQIELRILAEMSKDKSLIGAFKEGRDIHRITASQIFDVEVDDVTDEQRRRAKAINFGILYGKSAFSLSNELGITRKEASDIIKRYFEQFPTIQNFIDRLKNDAKEYGHASTLFGRKRPISGINAKNKMVQNAAERVAVNTPMQGTAADIIKVAMQTLSEALKKGKFKSKLLLQVHDELVLEVPKAELEKVKKLVASEMEAAASFHDFPKISVPLSVDVGVGDNWRDLK